MSDVQYFEEEKSKRILIRKRQRPENVTRIHNDCVENKSLSSDGLALLTYIMKKPFDWTVEIFDISNRFNWERKKTYRVLNHLQDLGYMRRIQDRRSDGTLGKWYTEVSDEPIFLSEHEILPESQKGNVVCASPDPQKPHSGKRDSGDYIRQKKDLTNIKTTTTEVILTPKDVVVSYMVDFGYEKKCAIKDLEEFGEARCREVIEHVKKLPEKKDSPVGYVRYLLKTKASLSSKKGPSSPYNDATPIIQHFDSFKKSDNMPIGVKLLAKKLRGAKNGLDN